MNQSGVSAAGGQAHFLNLAPDECPASSRTTSARGADVGDNTWYIDGIPITHMTTLGSSPTCYDFDMFQEMHPA